MGASPYSEEKWGGECPYPHRNGGRGEERNCVLLPYGQGLAWEAAGGGVKGKTIVMMKVSKERRDDRDLSRRDNQGGKGAIVAGARLKSGTGHGKMGVEMCMLI
jgi:hypothetical protein